MKETKHDFLGIKLDRESTSPQKSRYVLSLIPYEQTTTYKKGTASAPEAMVDASQHIELFDEAAGIDASLYGVATMRPLITDLQSVSAHAREVRRRHEGALLGFLGGEHSITPAIIEGLFEGEMGIVWIDAHADLREAYCERSDNHACAARNCLQFGRIVQIGVRSLAEEEYLFLEQSEAVVRCREWGDQAKNAIRALPSRVYLSFDMDGLNPALVRAVGTPEPGGLGWAEALEIVELVCREKELMAFDVVELCPSPYDAASEFTAARLVYKIVTHHALCISTK